MLLVRETALLFVQCQLGGPITDLQAIPTHHADSQQPPSTPHCRLYLQAQSGLLQTSELTN